MSASAELWCCDVCEQIGSVEQAQGHEANTGHAVRKLTAAEERGVREIWAEEGRSPLDGAQSSGVLGVLLTDYGKQLVRGLARSFGGGGGGLDGPDF